MNVQGRRRYSLPGIEVEASNRRAAIVCALAFQRMRISAIRQARERRRLAILNSFVLNTVPTRTPPSCGSKPPALGPSGKYGHWFEDWLESSPLSPAECALLHERRPGRAHLERW